MLLGKFLAGSNKPYRRGWENLLLAWCCWQSLGCIRSSKIYRHLNTAEELGQMHVGIVSWAVHNLHLPSLPHPMQKCIHHPPSAGWSNANTVFDHHICLFTFLWLSHPPVPPLFTHLAIAGPVVIFNLWVCHWGHWNVFNCSKLGGNHSLVTKTWALESEDTGSLPALL